MKRPSLAPLAALIAPALIVILVGPSVWRGHIPFFMDIVAQFYPIRFTAAQTLHEGLIPLWNPHCYCGVPLLANPQWGVLSPLNWPFFAVPSGHTFMLGYLLSHLILVSGGYWLARGLGLPSVGAVATALALGLGSWSWAHYPFGAYLAAVCWAPWFLGCLERNVREPSLKWTLGAGVLWALQIVAGAPQAAFLCSLAYGALALMLCATVRSRAPIKLLIGALLIALLLSAAQWLPMLELLQHTVRGGKLPFEEVAGGTLQLTGDASLLNALFGGNLFVWNQGEDAESTAYIGAVGILLALIGLLPHSLLASKSTSQCLNESTSQRIHASTQWRYFALVLLAFLWSWSALARPLHAAVPGYGEFHDPKRALLVAHLALAVLIGLGVTWITTREPSSTRLTLFSALAATWIGLGAFLVRAAIDYSAANYPRLWIRDSILVSPLDAPLHWIMQDFKTANLVVTVGLTLSLIVGTLGISALVTVPLRRFCPALAAGAVLLLVTDLHLFSWRRVDTETITTEWIMPTPDMEPMLTHLREGESPGWRVAGADSRVEHSYLYDRWQWKWHLLPNQSSLFGLNDAQGFDPTIPARARRFADLLNEGFVALYPRQFILIRNWASPLIDLMALRWVVQFNPNAYQDVRSVAPGAPSQLPTFQDQEPAIDRDALAERYELVPTHASLGENLSGSNYPVRQRFSHFDESGAPVMQLEDLFLVYRVITAQPRLVHRATAIGAGDVDEAIAALRNLGDRVHEVTVLEGDEPPPGTMAHIPGDGASMEIVAFRESANTVTATLDAPMGWVVLRDQMLPGWRAWIDDEEVEIIPADVMFRAVFWPGGAHTLRFAHQPTTFRLGWFLSLSALAGLLAAALAVRRPKSLAAQPNP